MKTIVGTRVRIIGLLIAVGVITFAAAAAVAFENTRLNGLRQKAFTAANAATLAGVGETKRLLEAGRPLELAISAGEEYAQHYFQALIDNHSAIVGGVFKIKIKENRNGIVGDGSFSENVETVFSDLIGLEQSVIEITLKTRLGRS